MICVLKALWAEEVNPIIDDHFKVLCTYLLVTIISISLKYDCHKLKVKSNK